MDAEVPKQKTGSQTSSGVGEQQAVASKHIVSYAGCHGTISWDDAGEEHNAVVTFVVDINRTGEIHLEFDDQVLTKENVWIKRAFSGSSSAVPALHLDGQTADGLVLSSESVHLTAVGTPSDQESVRLQVRAKAQRLTATAADRAGDEPYEFQAEYWVAGLRWFRGTTFTLPEGEVAVGGDVKPDDYAVMSGTVVIRSPSQQLSLDAWLSDADAAVRRILDVVSFADGHFLRPSVRQVFGDEELARVDFLGAGQGASPRQPPLHCLDFANSVPPLIHAYTPDLIERTGIDVAIEWHLMPHLYNEARFVSQMTAIEHLIHVFSEQSPDSTFIDKATFNKEVAPAVIKTLDCELAKLSLGGIDAADARQGMKQSLKGINRRSLRSNLDRMMRAYAVPLDGLDDVIKPLIDMRNDIVHRGLSREGNGDSVLGQRVAEAEELLKRVILALLGFEGRYTSWVNEVGDREFNPPA